MRYLALDIGDKRTGLAVGDDSTGLVSPVGFIAAEMKAAAGDGKGREWEIPNTLLMAVRQAVEEHGPAALVVGLPLNMDGSHGPRAKMVAHFAEKIADAVSLPVHLHDERLSTFEADQRMSRSGLTHKQKKERRDALAAMAILEDFLRARAAGADRAGEP